MIRSRIIYALLTLVIVFYFAPANAQNKKTTAKKAPAKTTKTTTKKAPPVKQKPAAKKTDNTAARDTTKKGGQNNPDTKNNASLSEEIIVTTAYKPVLADAVKIRRNPDLADKTPFKAPLTYITLDKRLERNTDIHQLEAMKMPAEIDSIPSNNYARIGIGNFKTTFGEAYVNNGKDAGLQLGAYVKHLAQSGSSIYKQNENRDVIGVFGKAITDDNTFSGRINYEHRGTYFYGYDPLNPPTAFSPFKQHFSTLSGEGEITKNFKDVENDFTYAVKLNGYNWSNAYQASESNVVITGFLNETIKQFYAGLGASLDISTQKDSLYSFNNSILRLNPYLKFQGDNYKIDAGLNLVREFGFSSRVFIFPAAKLELQVIPKYVRLFAEIKGDVNKSSLRDFSETNPFVGENIAIKNSVDKLDIALGLKGTIAPGLGFKATIFRNTVKEMPLFVNNFSTVNNRFSVIYDNGNARVSGFNGELDYKASDDFDLFGRVEFKDYKMASEAQAWNLPKFKLTVGTVIHITPQLSINGTLLYRGNTYDKGAPFTTTGPGATTTTTPTLLPISSFADLSGGVEYKVNNRISIFGQVNNILNSTNQVWLYYPNYGFNIFGGVGFHF
ncbi:MAG TPA: hypothetical protein VK668_23695 [Mucilaginibacter sp.]|nr:hypothetical protein [Mucilaginibacter sp.]